MRILVTGRHGQVARSLAEVASVRDEFELLFVARPEVDLERPGSLAAAIAAARPDLVINAAAYTAVDQAESEPERAFRINRDASGEAAEAAAKCGAPIIQLSTDYVFDGMSSVPYREDDETGPINVYGASKLAGEQAVARANPNHLIVRTSWVYSPYGRNFVTTILGLTDSRDMINVVDDQIGSPTNALDLASALLSLAPLAAEGEANGILHITGAGEASWADFAELIVKLSADLHGSTVIVRRIPTVDFPTPARRPLNCRLDSGKIRDRIGLFLPAWQEATEVVVRRLFG